MCESVLEAYALKSQAIVLFSELRSGVDGNGAGPPNSSSPSEFEKAHDKLLDLWEPSNIRELLD